MSADNGLSELIRDLKTDVKEGFLKTENKFDSLFEEITSLKIESKDHRNSLDSVHGKIRDVESKVENVKKEVDVLAPIVRSVDVKGNSFVSKSLDEVRKSIVYGIMLFIMIFLMKSCDNVKPALYQTVKVVTQDTSMVKK